jgi:SpoVK/Ycf46/Vps4 family AAA+-type ATPase
VKFDREGSSLRFRSEDEAEAFHRELTALVRQANMAAMREVADADEAVERTREQLQHFKTVARALNAMRRSLPRHGR